MSSWHSPVTDYGMRLLGVGAINSGGWLFSMAANSVLPVVLTFLGTVVYAVAGVVRAYVDRDKRHLLENLKREREMNAYLRSRMIDKGLSPDPTDH